MFIVPDDILLRIRVETAVGRFVDFAICSASWQIGITLIFYPFVDVKEVDSLEVFDFFLLAFPEVRC